METKKKKKQSNFKDFERERNNAWRFNEEIEGKIIKVDEADERGEMEEARCRRWETYNNSVHLRSVVYYENEEQWFGVRRFPSARE